MKMNSDTGQGNGHGHGLEYGYRLWAWTWTLEFAKYLLSRTYMYRNIVIMSYHCNYIAC